MDLRVICSECGEGLDARVCLVSGNAIEVKPHKCEEDVEETYGCTLNQALDNIKDAAVEVTYIKKNGDYRTLHGFFPKADKSPVGVQKRTGYVFFLESMGAGFAPKNLIRTGIVWIGFGNVHFEIH